MRQSLFCLALDTVPRRAPLQQQRQRAKHFARRGERRAKNEWPLCSYAFLCAPRVSASAGQLAAAAGKLGGRRGPRARPAPPCFTCSARAAGTPAGASCGETSSGELRWQRRASMAAASRRGRRPLLGLPCSPARERRGSASPAAAGWGGGGLPTADGE